VSQFTKEKLEKLRRSTRFNPRPRKRKRSGENGRKRSNLFNRGYHFKRIVEQNTWILVMY